MVRRLPSTIRSILSEAYSNTVLFNIWSACLQSRDQATPYFGRWIEPCAGNMTQVTYLDYPLHNAVKGVNIPTWAYLNVTAAGEYDSNGVNASE